MREIDSRLLALRSVALSGRDPTCPDEVLELLLQLAEKLSPKKILEVGAGECLTSIALSSATGASVIAIERDPVRCKCAREHVHTFGLDSFVTLHEGDAGEILPLLGSDGSFDLIFLDGPKAQYRRYLPDLKRLLRVGGVLVSDDVLLFGWVRGEPPKKRRMLVEHIREYLALLQSDSDFSTRIYELGEGVAVSKRLL